MFTTYTYLGGANGENKTKVFTVNLDDGYIFELVDLIELQDKDKFKAFNKIVNRTVVDNESLNETINEQSLKDSLAVYDHLEWSIHQNKLRLYFNEYEIAAGSEGIVKLDIPLEKLTKLINKEIVDQFEL